MEKIKSGTGIGSQKPIELVRINGIIFPRYKSVKHHNEIVSAELKELIAKTFERGGWKQ